ncbi:MAG TPA: C45 family autoproteolytic acyltransferase/hydrolase [Spirochaetota bacterium]|nr:C45 family autoproteolytic acyltransferase/hydrolase [Spirochaetota bacterium]
MFYKHRSNDYKNNSKLSDRKIFGGELKYIEGYPVVFLKGTYYTMGLQYGLLLKKEIRELYKKNQNRKTEVIKHLPWYMKPISGFIMALVAGYSLLRIPPKYLKEIAGLALGSKVPFTDILTAAFGGVVFDAACTSIFVKYKGTILHAHNLDFEPAYLGLYPAIVIYNHPKKLKYMHLGVAGVPGMFHGINEKGISVAVNYGDGTYNKENKGLPMGYKLREILEKATSIDDVEAILKKAGPDELGWIITVGSSIEKKCATFDIFDGIIVRRDYPMEGTAYVLNDIFSPERLQDISLSKKYLQISRGAGLYNIARRERLDKYLKKHSIQSIDDMIELLRDYDLAKYKKFTGSLNSTIVNERTLHTIIFDNNSCKVFIAAAEGYSALSDLISFDLLSGEGKLYKEAEKEFRSDSLKKFMEWYSLYQEISLVHTVTQGISRRFSFVKFKTPDFSSVINDSIVAQCSNPRELWSLFRLWNHGKEVKTEVIINSSTRLIEKFKELAVLYIIKAKALTRIKQYKEAEDTLLQSLKCKIISPYDRIHIYNDLAGIYLKIKEKEKAREYAQKNIEVIETLSCKYSCGDKTGKIYSEMKKLIKKSSLKKLK